MLKVVYICSSLIRRGPINVLYNLVSGFNKSEIECVIITLSDEENDSRKQDFISLGITVKCLQLGKGFDSILRSSKLKDAVKNERPDICHSFGFRADILCYKELRNKYKIVSSLYNYPGDDYVMQFGKIKGHLMKKIHFHILNGFTKVITCSAFIEEKLRLNRINNVDLIYTGVDSNYFCPATIEERNRIRRLHNVSEDSIVYIYIANLIIRKDPITLIKAFKDFVNNPIKKVHLFVMGDGMLMEACKSTYNGDNISYLGYQSDTLPYLQASDFYISPSLSEGFPTAVLEALSCGLPCILSDIQPHQEMMYDIKKPFFFRVSNINSLKDALNRSIECNLDEEKKLHRKYFTSNFTSKLMADKHLKTYLKLNNNE